MIEVTITEAMKKKAQNKSHRMGKLKNSITNGKGNIAGFLGEFLVEQYLGGIIESTRDYDLILPSGKKIDVKTKRCTSEPLPDYDCSIAAYNTVQKCDAYVFVRIENISGKWGRAWILGWMGKDDYFAKSRFLRKNERDGSNWFKVKADCYNLPIQELKDINKLK